MALYNCADVPLRNYSLTQEKTKKENIPVCFHNEINQTENKHYI